jgi:hypothetical protein
MKDLILSKDTQRSLNEDFGEREIFSDYANQFIDKMTEKRKRITNYSFSN